MEKDKEITPPAPSYTKRGIIGDIYILGGKRQAALYRNLLMQAKKEKSLDYHKLYFVEPEEVLKKPEHIQKTYVDFLENYLSRNNSGLPRPEAPRNDGALDLLIPDHFAPHVLLQCFLELIKKDKRFFGYTIKMEPFQSPLPNPLHNIPFQKILDSGIVALSFATWTCPLECEEGDVCPHIDKQRTWHFKDTFEEYTKHNPHLSSHLFFCEQLIHGIAAIPLQKIAQSWSHLESRLLQQKDTELFVATFSKCHGIMGKALVSQK